MPVLGIGNQIQSETFHQWLTNPQTLDAQTIPILEEITRAYPWFAQAHSLLALAQKRAGSSQYQNTLHKAALAAPDRQAIYFLLEKNFSEIPESKKETLVQPSALEIKVDTENWVDIILDEVPPVVLKDDWVDIQLDLSKKEAESEKESEKEKEFESEDYTHSPLPESVDFAELGELGQDIINKAISSSIELEVSEKEEEETLPPSQPAPAEYEDDFLNFIAHSIGELAEPPRPITGWSEPETATSPSKSADPIIERFIQTEPQINRGKAIEYSAGNMAKESLEEDVNLVTETMAKLYVKQGKLDKARKAYKKLIELYPEKSVYFATQLKNLNKKN